MLSVVIATQDSERTLVPTLAALVGGAAAGMVREVIVADSGSRDATAAIADDAGCRLITSASNRGARLKAAADAARGAWLLFLQPGVVPDPTWIDETRGFVEHAELAGRADLAATFRKVSAPFRPPMADALDLFRAALGGRPKASQGLLIATSLYAALGGHREVDAPETELIRRLGRRRIVLLRTGVFVRTDT
jgi:glycosyltransferase involved in cell wall biosynthesis